MSDVLLLYLFTRLDSIEGLAWAIAVVGAMGAVVAIAIVGMLAEDGAELGTQLMLRWAKRLSVCAAIGAVVLVVVPNQKEAAIIVGGKMTIDAIRSPEAAEIGSAVKDAVLKKLKDAAK